MGSRCGDYTVLADGDNPAWVAITGSEPTYKLAASPAGTGVLS